MTASFVQFHIMGQALQVLQVRMAVIGSRFVP